MGKRIKISSAKAKGRRLQQWVAKKISEMCGVPYGPDELIQSRSMSQAGMDIALLGHMKDDFPFAVECKAGKNIGWQAAIKQAKANQGNMKNWMVVVRADREKPVIMLDADIFFEIYTTAFEWE